MKIICWLKNKLFGRRVTSTDCIKREYYNSLFTELQDIREKLQHWDFRSRQGYSQTQLLVEEKMQLLLSYNQIEQQRKYTLWFIVLTIFNIVVLIATFTIGFLFRNS